MNSDEKISQEYRKIIEEIDGSFIFGKYVSRNSSVKDLIVASYHWGRLHPQRASINDIREFKGYDLIPHAKLDNGSLS